MRIVATSDTHKKVDISIVPDGDVFIHAGDLMTTGYPDDWKEQLVWLAELPHKEKLYVPGNHDFHICMYPGPALQDMRKIGVKVIGLPGNDMFATHTLDNGMILLGLPFVKSLPRWAFNTNEYKVREYLERMPACDIVVSHSPVYGILDGDGSFNAGFKCYVDYIKKHNPKFWIHGHIHEAYGYRKFINTDVYNVALCDREHNHVNPPLVLDL